MSDEMLADAAKPQRGIQSLDNTGQLLGALVDAGSHSRLGNWRARRAWCRPRHFRIWSACRKSD